MGYGRNRILGLALLCCAVVSSALGQSAQQYEKLRQQMVDEVIVGSGIKNPRVIESMRATERHKLMAEKYRKHAYFDMALPIGEQQTISSPYIVAYMTEVLDPQKDDKVLEIGTGSGYQAAILAPLVKDVYTIEIVESLGKSAEKNLQAMGYKNIHVKVGDGFKGWPDKAPFDKIIATCSPEKVPQPLVDQLAEGGRMVIPVGERYQQTMFLFRKKDGKLESEALRPTLFVPMTGTAEDERKVKPDPKNPVIRNGSFEDETKVADKNFVPGWYYHRLTKWEEDANAPDGKHCISFENDISGRSSHLLQGLPVDGAFLGELQVSAWVKASNIEQGRESYELPVVAITFYDEQRRDLGTSWIGPFKSDQDWKPSRGTFRVPPTTKEAILRLGLFGGTGKVSFDNITLTAIPRKTEKPKPVEVFK